jgi:hypothetical protein
MSFSCCIKWCTVTKRPALKFVQAGDGGTWKSVGGVVDLTPGGRLSIVSIPIVGWYLAPRRTNVLPPGPIHRPKGIPRHGCASSQPNPGIPWTREGTWVPKFAVSAACSGECHAASPYWDSSKPEL